MPNDPEFEKWLAAQGTYQKLDPYTLALNAWREARWVQMELDCKAICIQCDQGVPVSESKAGIKYHAVSQSNNPECAAFDIRAAFEKEHPE